MTLYTLDENKGHTMRHYEKHYSMQSPYAIQTRILALTASIERWYRQGYNYTHLAQERLYLRKLLTRISNG